jgi:predicted GNAT superfamily acetyltransferase
MSFHLDLIDPNAPAWPTELATLWRDLGAPHNPELLPDYFVQTTFVRMGGHLLRLRDGDSLRGVALLFPRGIVGGRRAYTLRVSERAGGRQAAGNGVHADYEQIAAVAEELLAPHALTVYLPRAARGYRPTHRRIGEFCVGAPGPDELAAIRAMHIAIWGPTPGAQYPDDLHSAEFEPATSLVARADGQLAGFLLGFHRFGGLDGLERAGIDTTLSIESQVMGVDAGLRRAGLAATLKRAQAAEALDRGIEVIHWTADPLQFANATLNFHKLRAVAGEFYPAYYPFQNELNRVPASRFGITWLLSTAWGRAGMSAGPRRERSLARFPDCAILNSGPNRLRAPADVPHIAIEIPADWTDLQATNLDVASAWRAASDAILAEVVGYTPERYLIADIAIEGERRYLIGHRAETVLQVHSPA